MLSSSRLPFGAHVLVELPAACNFLLRPSEQLSIPAPQAHAVIQQYGALLLVSVIIALIFALRPVDPTSRISSYLPKTHDQVVTCKCVGRVSGALALYHLAPLSRAISRIREGDFGYGQGLGGPWVHLLVHFIVLLGLVQLWARGRNPTPAGEKQQS
jgi:hypothetical protein